MRRTTVIVLLSGLLLASPSLAEKDQVCVLKCASDNSGMNCAPDTAYMPATHARCVQKANAARDACIKNDCTEKKKAAPPDKKSYLWEYNP